MNLMATKQQLGTCWISTTFVWKFKDQEQRQNDAREQALRLGLLQPEGPFNPGTAGRGQNIKKTC